MVTVMPMGVLWRRFQFFVVIPNTSQVRSPRAGIHFLQHVIAQFMAFQLIEPGCHIILDTLITIQVAESYRLGWASLLACGHYRILGENGPISDVFRSIFRLLIMHLLFDTCFVDALHAVRAFLHHTTKTDGHVRVPLKLQHFCFIISELVKIETTNLVRAII